MTPKQQRFVEEYLIDLNATQAAIRAGYHMTPKQQRFVEEYLIDLNATQAAIRAGYSARTAGKIGFQLLEKTRIAEGIAAAQEARSKRTEITADRVVEELAKVGFANAGDYFDWGPGGITVRDKADLTPEQQAAVVEVSETTTKDGGTIRVKLHSKLDALEKLGKHLGMFKDIVELRRTRDVSELSTDELLAIIHAGESGEGTPGKANGPGEPDKLH